MSFIYKSLRVGKHGKVFEMIKFRTLREGSNTSYFAGKEAYTRFGHFLRKFHLDELPQLWNVIKGDLRIVGPRAEEKRTIDIIPKDIRDILLSVRPGLTSLASLHFFDEERILQVSNDLTKTYWTQVKPMKILLDVFYVQNRSVLLDIAIIWGTIRKIITRK